MQLVEAATGLEYMHGLNMVHGDLKGVRFFDLLDAHVFTMKGRRTSSSKVTVPASQILGSRPLSVWSTTSQLTPP